jgi:hypothetical protein
VRPFSGICSSDTPEWLRPAPSRQVRVTATGPVTVLYPETFARAYGVYGGRTRADEIEAAHVIRRLLHKAVRARVEAG